ncbi:protein abrupt-like [Hyalella azteca]|uniref:Protein abrupt-like n=1 Tax=Hyalella azteca TaxID=294128 RepID=A0A8B7P4W4_HYAAZ|nr:protein abrupt-like [Hyalella azteca]
MDSDMEDKQLSLTWNNHSSTYKTMFNMLRHKNLLTDITLACDGQQFLAHKLVLATCSHYFQTMLCAVPDGGHPIVYLRDVPASEIKAILEFMYTGEACVPQSQVGSLLKTAECLKIKGLGVQPHEELSSASEDLDDDLDADGNVVDSRCRVESFRKFEISTKSEKLFTHSKSLLTPAVKRNFSPEKKYLSTNSATDILVSSPKKMKTSASSSAHSTDEYGSQVVLSPNTTTDATTSSRTDSVDNKFFIPFQSMKAEPHSPVDVETVGDNENVLELTKISEAQALKDCQSGRAPLSRSTKDALAEIFDLEDKYRTDRSLPSATNQTSLHSFSSNSLCGRQIVKNQPITSMMRSSDTSRNGLPSLEEQTSTSHEGSESFCGKSLVENGRVAKGEAKETKEEEEALACNPSSFEEEAQFYLEAFTRSAGLSLAASSPLGEDALPGLECAANSQEATAARGSFGASAKAAELEDLENRPYTCPICRKSFGKAAILKRHHLAHFRPYSCNVCQRSFTRREVLAEHLQEHNGADMRLPCPVCAMTIKRKRNLQAHIKVKHPEYYRHKIENKLTLF